MANKKKKNYLHGYPAYSHHDKIPPWWGSVSNDEGGNVSAQVINSSTVASSEVQEQDEVEDQVPTRSSQSRNVQPENIYRFY